MNKTIIAAAVTSCWLPIAEVGATVTQYISILDMTLIGAGTITATYAADGALLDIGGGEIFSIDPLFGRSWTATQETLFLDNTDTWNGTSAQGDFNYDAEISNMTDDQIAVGMYWNWGANTGIPLLEIFDCTGIGTVEDPSACFGNGVIMQNGSFSGVAIVFNISAVPVPATAWLMGSGLLGLAGLACRRK